MKKKMSLQEEVKQEACSIEEILNKPELADLNVSEQFDSEMASKIREYEEKNKPGNP